MFISTLTKEKLLSFQHGIHPKDYKYLSNSKPIERMPFVEEYLLPLSQHIGAPARAIVKKGAYVYRGQKIAESSGFVSVPLHSPVDGEIIAIDLFEHPNGQLTPAIKVKTDPFSTQEISLTKIRIPDTADEFIAEVQNSGLVGLGGAAFPSHVKFVVPDGKKCKYMMLNGCECEPFLTADHRIMVEQADLIIEGIKLLSNFVKAEKAYIGIENNKQEAIKILKEKAKKENFPIEVVTLKVKYPQGAEKMMITAILGKEVPVGTLPIDLGVMVTNVGTIAALSNYFTNGIPLIERVVTVTGTAIKYPSNIMVPIGTPIKEILDFCGGVTHNDARIIIGGPMMGMAQKNLNAPIVKGTSGILALTPNEVKSIEEYNCIRCGKCVDACPMFLNPSLLGLLAKKGLWEEMNENNMMDCFECACCSFVCPSGIPLVQSFRVAKGMIREKIEREKVQDK